MTQTKEQELQTQIATLQAQIDYLKNGGITLTPARRLRNIRHECREKYFGSWNAMREGETQYGPGGKTYSDYDAIMTIVQKMSDLLFKYSYGKAAGKIVITRLLATEADEQRYKEICERVCKCLRDGIDEYSKESKKEVWADAAN